MLSIRFSAIAVAAGATLGLMGGTAMAAADDPTIYPVLAPWSLSTAPANRAARSTASSDSGAGDLPQASEVSARSSRWSSLPLPRAALLEMPADQIPGQYRRPTYALAFRSDTLRTWLNGMGVDARSCLAPVIRMRTKRSASGEWNGMVLMLARCNFY